MDKERAKNLLFFKLYNSLQLRLYSYLLVLVHNSSDAEDILQETAAVLWEKFDQYQEGTNFASWAFSVARYKALQFLRTNKNTRMIFDADFYEKVSQYAQQVTEDADERAAALQQCLEKIPENGRKLLFMRYGKNIPIKKISQLTGRSDNSLYQHFWKIIQVLRACIEKKLTSQDAR
ncbi:MAG TPA: sigma-70 family RNA polymerase sigma factor [Anaerohalosphaeraceae bacterium]|nr:sigma-70 family RNA polymerase sigma factor [Anaerohalosphaeraceae bacterium]HPD48180.1 sigma-70 family RNA polymerase sigma factor [Anaerohalosphaeraceae bacterium]HRT24332.1 sigma-70 family RNA polymerase sigma factor [Anaerohalosphaeraceae bacterium]